MMATRVLIRMHGRFSHVGDARLEVDEETGMRLLRADLSAMAPSIYIPLADIHVLEVQPASEDEDLLAALPVAGTA